MISEYIKVIYKMQKSIPKFHETFIPILNVLKNGEELHYQELRRRVRDQYYADLPEELLTKKTSTGDILILNRIGWAKAYLKQAKFIEQPRRAFVKITSKGLARLANNNLTLSELKKDIDYKAAESEKGKLKSEKVVDIDEKDYSPQDLIEQGLENIKENLKADLLEKLKVIDPYYFEKVILILLKKMGYGEFVETKKSGDGGVDGIINQDQLGISKIYIQAKRYTENKIREKDIRNFIGAMSGDTTNGVFVTTSSFDESAIRKAKEAHHKIILIDGIRLTELMFEFNVGLQTVNTYELKEVDQDFFEDS
jgi:restriction system protein